MRDSRAYVYQLLRIMQENPRLEVLCKVDSDIVADDGAWWLGKIDTNIKIEVDEYSTDIAEEVKFRSDEDYDDWFESMFDYADYDYISDEQWQELIKNEVDKKANWKKAILISITTV